jgi:acylphosphatase
MQSERRTVIFTGRVQGVGFRMTTVQFAKGLPISGTVKNLSDGDVELVVTGPPSQIDALVNRLTEHFDADIRTQHHAPADAPRATGIQIIH